MFKKILSIAPKVFFVLCALALILVAKGFKFDFDNNTLVQTGILDVHTQPKGATIYLDSDEHGISPNKITGLTPSRYQLTLNKEGYSSWQRYVTINPLLATQVFDIILFPENPILRKETNANYDRILTSQDNERIILFSQDQDQNQTDLSILSEKLSELMTTNLPLSLNENNYLEAFWANNHDYCLLNIYANSSSTSTLLHSYFFDMLTQKSPVDLLSLDAFENNNEPLLDPICGQDSPQIVFKDSNGSIISYNLDDNTSDVMLSTAEDIAPLFITPASGILGQPLLYFTKKDPGQNTSTLWSRELATGNEKQISQSYQLRNLSDFTISNDHNNLILEDDNVSVIITNIKSDSPKEKVLPRQMKARLGWSPDSERFLFVSEDDQIAYYDQLQDTFLYPYRLATRESFISACWHPDSKHIFLLLTTTTNDVSKQIIKSVEYDGKNIVTILDDAQNLAGVEAVDTDVTILCPDKQSLIFGSEINRNGDQPLRYLYSMSFE